MPTDEDLRLMAEDSRMKRGFADGEEGLSPSEASEAYLEGFMKGRKALSKNRITKGCCPTCGQTLPARK